VLLCYIFLQSKGTY